MKNFVKEIVSNVDPESTADFTNNCISMMADEYSSNSYPLQLVGAGGYGDPNGFYGWCGGCFSYKCDDDLIDILLSMNMW